MINICNFKNGNTCSDESKLVCNLCAGHGQYGGRKECTGENNCIIYQIYENTLNIKIQNELKNMILNKRKEVEHEQQNK